MNNSSRLPLITGLLTAGLVVALAWNGVSHLSVTWNPFQLNTQIASGPVVLDQIQRLNRLETCRYNGQVIVEGKKRNWLPGWMSGDRILFVGRGEVVAGLDMAQLHPQDISVRGTAVTVRLPDPQILHTRLDNHQSEVFERQAGVFSGPDPHLESEVRVEAEDKIRHAAVESGVLDTARTNAKEALRQNLSQLGFRDVRFL